MTKTCTFRRTIHTSTARCGIVCPNPEKRHTGQHWWQARFTDTNRQRAFRGAHTFVCLVSPCFWCDSFGLQLWLSGQRSSFCLTNVKNEMSAKDWSKTGQRCGQTASGRISGLRAPAQMHMVDWLWHTWKRNTLDVKCINIYWASKSREPYSPFGTLTLCIQMSISQSIDAKTQHVVCFQGFTKQITITATILQKDNTSTALKMDHLQSENCDVF